MYVPYVMYHMSNLSISMLYLLVNATQRNINTVLVQTLKNSELFLKKFMFHVGHAIICNFRFLRFWDVVGTCYGWHYQNRKHFIQKRDA